MDATELETLVANTKAMLDQAFLEVQSQQRENQETRQALDTEKKKLQDERCFMRVVNLWPLERSFQQLLSATSSMFYSLSRSLLSPFFSVCVYLSFPRYVCQYFCLSSPLS